jgi:hypothetical protein
MFYKNSYVVEKTYLSLLDARPADAAPTLYFFLFKIPETKDGFKDMP